MKNLVHTIMGACIALALPVPAGTKSGDVRVLGGITVLAKTDRATTATIQSGEAAAGLADGEASVILDDVQNVMLLALDGAVAQFAKVYLTAAGVYTATAAGNTAIGVALAALTAPGLVKVAIKSA